MADLRSGVALLKIDLATPFLPIGKSSELGLATPVVAIGYPLDLPGVAKFRNDCRLRPKISWPLLLNYSPAQ